MEGTRDRIVPKVSRPIGLEESQEINQTRGDRQVVRGCADQVFLSDPLLPKIFIGEDGNEVQSFIRHGRLQGVVAFQHAGMPMSSLRINNDKDDLHERDG